MADEKSGFYDWAWQKFIEDIERSVQMPTRLLRAAFSTRGFRDVIQHFQKQMGPDGPWKPLSPSTIAMRRKGRRRGSAQALQDTGNLRRNFLPANVRDRDRYSIIFFNPTPYAAYHDEGNMQGRPPQREFMYLTNEALEDMAKIILEKVVGKELF